MRRALLDARTEPAAGRGAAAPNVAWKPPRDGEASVLCKPRRERLALGRRPPLDSSVRRHPRAVRGLDTGAILRGRLRPPEVTCGRALPEGSGDAGTEDAMERPYVIARPLDARAA